MKMFRNYLPFALFSVMVIATMTSTATGQALNIIEGRIVSEGNQPVYNAYVELYNNFGAPVGRTRSSSSGRFSFRNLPGGRFTIQVKPLGTNLLEASETVELYNLTSYSPDIQYVEFRLEVDKRLTARKPQITAVVFAQEVPPDAKRKFESGKDKLQTGNETGLYDLEQAIEIFPEYFDALSVRGQELVTRGKYKDGYPLLLRAIDVNRRCGPCYYSLGIAFYKLGETEAAIKAAEAAALLEPGSGDVFLLNGIVLRLGKRDQESETALLKAETMFADPNPEVHHQLALLYNQMKLNSKAADRLEQYLKTATDLSKADREELKKLVAKLRSAGDK